MFSRKILPIFGAVALVLAGVALLVWSRTKNAPPPFLSGLTANGYDDFVRAGKLLVGTPEEAGNLGDFVKTNRPALDAFRRGLKSNVEAPVETYNIHSLSATVLPSLSLLKELGKAVKAEGQKAEEARNYTEAATIYLELIEFGQKVQHGPLIFLLTGLAIEDLGFGSLQEMEKHFTDQDRATVGSRLEKLATVRIPFEGVLEREHLLTRRNSPTPIHYLLFLRMMPPATASAQRKYEAMLTAQREFVDKLKQARPNEAK